MDCVGVAARPGPQRLPSTPHGVRHPKGLCSREHTPVPERHQVPKRRRFSSEVTYLQPDSKGEKETLAKGDCQLEALAARTHQIARTARATTGEAAGGPAGLERLAVGFAEDYFASTLHAKINSTALSLAGPTAEDTRKASAAAAALASSAGLDQEQDGDPAGLFVSQRVHSWLEALQMGFSLLLEGVGSKWQVLEAFAETVLLPWGATVVRVNAFHARFSLLECLQELLEQLCPGAERPSSGLGSGSGSGSCSLETLTASLLAVQRDRDRPLCFVVHNLEMLPPAHQQCLARLTSSPHARVHLAASVDSIWAALCWTPRCLRDFNFLRPELQMQSGEAAGTGPEAAARFPTGMPAWCDVQGAGAVRRERRASIGVVLASLTKSHRELVQLLAEQQLERPAGCSPGMLLNMASDRMIASNRSKLQSLLKELQDHKVVAYRYVGDGATHYYLPVDERTLQQLARNGQLEASDAEESEQDD